MRGRGRMFVRRRRVVMIVIVPIVVIPLVVMPIFVVPIFAVPIFAVPAIADVATGFGRRFSGRAERIRRSTQRLAQAP
jgi:hypothetical protein